MDAIIQSKNIPVYRGLTDSYFELPIETEILVPDYVAEVFRIIKCTVGHTVFQKSMISGKILIEGYHKVSVFYQAENSSAICQIEQKLPFSKSLDYRGECIGEHRITVNGQCEYLNCRAINQRRIDVRGSYGMTASLRSFDEMPAVGAIDSETIYQKFNELSYISYNSTVEKQFTLEHDVEFYEAPRSVLYNYSGASVSSVEQVGDRIIVKGEVKTSISYISNQETFIKEVKTIPVNQVLEVDVEEGELIICPTITINSCSVMESENEGYVVSLNCVISAAIYLEQNQTVVKDAFSAESNYCTTYSNVELLSDRERVATDMTLSIPVPIIEDIVSVVDSFTTIGAIKVQHSEIGSQLMGELTVHLICENELGELCCLDNAGEYKISTTGSINESSFIDLAASVTNTVCNLSGKEVSVEVSVSVYGIICRKSSFSILQSIELTDTVSEEANAALCIYFADAGEAVFDIAKRYGASPEGIMSHNSLTEEILKSKQRLIVPV